MQSFHPHFGHGLGVLHQPFEDPDHSMQMRCDDPLAPDRYLLVPFRGYGERTHQPFQTCVRTIEFYDIVQELCEANLGVGHRKLEVRSSEQAAFDRVVFAAQHSCSHFATQPQYFFSHTTRGDEGM